jgi:hypothetical protein
LQSSWIAARKKARLGELFLFLLNSENGVNMDTIDIRAAGDAMSSMQALRSAMTVDLADVESRMQELSDSSVADSATAIDEMAVYCATRMALYSGLASIDEVLGWVHLMTEKDSDGNTAAVVRALPTIQAFSVH